MKSTTPSNIMSFSLTETYFHEFLSIFNQPEWKKKEQEWKKKGLFLENFQRQQYKYDFFVYYLTPLEIKKKGWNNHARNSARSTGSIVNTPKPKNTD